jgi:hypothetical protein
MDAATVAGFRADLVALNPYEGTTSFGPGFLPDTFATTRDGLTYVGVVNREPAPRSMGVDLGALGLGTETYFAFDVSTGEGRRVAREFSVDLPGRSFRLVVLRRDAGVLWTDSVVTAMNAAGSGLTATVRGPAAIPGFLRLAVSNPQMVLLDGAPLSRASSPQANVAYTYDEEGGVLSLAYSHTAERRIEVRW